MTGRRFGFDFAGGRGRWSRSAWSHVLLRHAKPVARGSAPTRSSSPPATQRDVPVYYDALGTVQAFNTGVDPRSVTGQLVSIDFQQGQGSTRAIRSPKIDPAPLKAILDQAVAEKSEDQAQLIDRAEDRSEFTTLFKKDFETQQNVEPQQAKVDQLKAMIDADQGRIEAAQTQLTIQHPAPIDGVGRASASLISATSSTPAIPTRSR